MAYHYHIRVTFMDHEGKRVSRLLGPSHMPTRYNRRDEAIDACMDVERALQVAADAGSLSQPLAVAEET